MFSCRALVSLSLFGVSAMSLSQQPAATTASPAPAKDTLSSLRAGFRNPPPQARLRCYWWWLNGNTDKATITHDLEEMKAKGFGGALLVDANGASQEGNRPVPAGPQFGSPAWTELYLHALREADRFGLEITLNIMSGWNLGGPTVTPEDASKLLTFSRTTIQGGKPLELAVAKPPSKNGFYRDIALLAYPLHHGTPLAPQPDARQGDHHTAAEQKHDDTLSPTVLYRAAAAESGFSMPDTTNMLDDGLATSFKGDKTYADASLKDVRLLKLDASGKAHIDLPAGQWELLRIGYTDSGALVSTSSDTWQGLAIDHLSKSAFNHYWDANVQHLVIAAKPYKSLKYLATDSWELGGTNWTDGFREEFIARRGYDPVPYLPIVAGRILGDRSVSTRFLTDLRRTVADLIADNHYDNFAAHAKKYGLGTQAESGGPHGAPIDALETFRHAAVPQTEFWSQNPHRADDKERFFTKEAASAANIYGKRFVAQEGETSIGPQWSESLAADLKPSFDMGITEGMNRLVWHEFTSSPASTGLPGQEYFAGTHLNPKITWWNAGRPFFDYLNRMQFLMQQGTPINDVLYDYGDNVPSFVRYKADDPAHVLPGYDYDVTNQDALLHDIRIEGAYLVSPSNVRWRVLALPRSRRLSLETLELVDRYLHSGGTVVSLPPLSPTGNVTAATQSRYNVLVASIWHSCEQGGHTVGTGHLFCSNDTHAALAQLNIKADVELPTAQLLASSNKGIDYVHRHTAAAEIYFLRNAAATPTTFPAIFRATGQAELWDPVAGVTHSIPTTSTTDHRSQLSLSLPAFGSAVVVFTSHSTSSVVPQPVRTESLQLHAPWSLHIDGVAPIVLKDLVSWTQLESIKYFSGTVNYRVSIIAPKLNPGETACLRFSNVHEIASVTLNGQAQPALWAAPYTTCFDSALHSGTNDLRISVTNLWHNRLIGDAQPGAHITTKTNIARPAANDPLLPSGLLGPAEWVIER
ncbi:MAG: glycosyl hydrolase [Edaphobacter sp.]|uniref:glycosyl hydrolase n=1 Tax=Edaphobacter sp. TaxID=1934404 RepID=UPI002388D2CF|nr:glycosyl hydrolase [Edaphobacter sp.]MDE1176025.1 glycosyl hydrolase [Edaphobacter sp.]